MHHSNHHGQAQHHGPNGIHAQGQGSQQVTTVLQLQPVAGPGPAMHAPQQQPANVPPHPPAHQANMVLAPAPGHANGPAHQIPAGLLATLANQLQQHQQQGAPQQAAPLAQQNGSYIVHLQPGPTGQTQLVLTLPGPAANGAGGALQGQAGGQGPDVGYGHVGVVVPGEELEFGRRGRPLQKQHPISQAIRDLVSFPEALRLWQFGIDGPAIRELEKDKTWRKGNEDVKKRVSELRGYIKLINVKRWKDKISWDDAAAALQREADDIIKRTRSMVTKLSGRYKLLETRYAHELAIAKAMADDVESCPGAAATRLQQAANMPHFDAPQPANGGGAPYALGPAPLAANDLHASNSAGSSRQAGPSSVEVPLQLLHMSGSSNLSYQGNNLVYSTVDHSGAGPSTMIYSPSDPNGLPQQHSGIMYSTDGGAPNGLMYNLSDPITSGQHTGTMVFNQHGTPLGQQVFINEDGQPTFLPPGLQLPTFDAETAPQQVIYQLNEAGQAVATPGFITTASGHQQAGPAEPSRVYLTVKETDVMAVGGSGGQAAVSPLVEQASGHSGNQQSGQVSAGEHKTSTGQMLEQSAHVNGDEHQLQQQHVAAALGQQLQQQQVQQQQVQQVQQQQQVQQVQVQEQQVAAAVGQQSAGVAGKPQATPAPTTVSVVDADLARDTMITMVRHALAAGMTLPDAAAYVVAALPDSLRQQVAYMVGIPDYQPDASHAGCPRTDGYAEWINAMLARLALSPTADNIKPFVQQLSQVWTDHSEDTRIQWEMFGAVVNLMEGRVGQPQVAAVEVATGAATHSLTSSGRGAGDMDMSVGGHRAELMSVPSHSAEGGSGSGSGTAAGDGPAATTSARIVSPPGAHVSWVHIKQEDGGPRAADDESRALKRPKM